MKCADAEETDTKNHRKMASYLCNYKCGKKQQFCTFDENVDRTDE